MAIQPGEYKFHYEAKCSELLKVKAELEIEKRLHSEAIGRELEENKRGYKVDADLGEALRLLLAHLEAKPVHEETAKFLARMSRTT